MGNRQRSTVREGGGGGVGRGGGATPAPRGLDGADGHAAPPAPDLQHVVVRLHARQRQHLVQLGQLRVLQAAPCAPPPTARLRRRPAQTSRVTSSPAAGRAPPMHAAACRTQLIGSSTTSEASAIQTAFEGAPGSPRHAPSSPANCAVRCRESGQGTAAGAGGAPGEWMPAE